MDFLDPKKTRQHMIRLMIGYVLVAIAVLLATTLLIMYAYGFRLSRDGKLNQLGLVFVSSQPTGADVLVDDKLTEATNAKLNLTAGSYGLTLARDGYVDWTRDITVEGGSVDHYVYPLLLPAELTSQPVSTFAAQPLLASQSPDKRWLVVQEAAGDSFALYDLDRPQTTVGEATPLGVPTNIVSTSLTPATWTIQEWSTNNRHMLAIRDYTTADGPAKEYILIDRARLEGSHNLTQELELAATATVHLRDKKPDNYYIFDKSLSELSTATLDAPEAELILTDVLAFKDHGPDVLLYATDVNTEAGETQFVLKEKEQTYDLRVLKSSDTYILDIARYESDWYVVIGSSDEKRTYLYRNPVDSIKRNQSGRPTSSFAFNMENPTHASFSGNAQFIALQNGTDVYVYDLENIQAFRFALPFPVDAPQTRAKWMDGHRLTYVSGGKQVITEYDNNNSRQLTDTSPRLGSFFDRNSEYMYGFTVNPDQTGFSLSATPLRTAADL